MKKFIRLKALICAFAVIAPFVAAPFYSYAAIDAGSGNLSETLNPKNMLVNVKDADVRDVLSAIAVNMGYNIVYTGPVTTVSLDLENIAPSAAFDYLLKTLNLTYLQEGSTFIVGDRDTLQNNFSRSLALTRFDLTYITPTVLGNMINQLSMPVTVVTLNANEKALWVQGFPTDIAKVRDLINVVDIKENKDEVGVDLPEEEKSVKTLSNIRLNHISSYDFRMLLQTLGIDYCVSIFDDDDRVYIYATPEERQTVLSIRSTVDRSSVYYDAIDTGESIELLKATPEKAGNVVTGWHTVAGKQTIISAISSMCPGLKIVSVDNFTAAFLVMGEREEISRAQQIMNMLNNEKNAKNLATTYFSYNLTFITAAEAERRLQNVTFGDNVTWYITTHPDFSGTIHVYCNSDYEQQVKGILKEKIDKEEEKMASRIRNIPIYAVTGDDASERAKYLNGIKGYLELMLNFGDINQSGEFSSSGNGIEIQNTYENIGFLYLDSTYSIEVVELVRVMIARLDEITTSSDKINPDEVSFKTWWVSVKGYGEPVPDPTTVPQADLAEYVAWVTTKIESKSTSGANRSSAPFGVSGASVPTYSLPNDDDDDDYGNDYNSSSHANSNANSNANTNTNSNSDTNTNTSSSDANTDGDNKSEQPAYSEAEAFAIACTALEEAIYGSGLDEKVTYETGESTIFRLAEEAVKVIPNAIVVWNPENPANKIKPTASENGSLAVSLILNVGSQQKTYDIALTLPAAAAAQP